MLRNIFFDLDGTLITMDQDEFIKKYFHLIGKKMSENGFDKELIYKALYDGIMAMYKGGGGQTCEQLFWAKFYSYFSKKQHNKLVSLFSDFYDHDFDILQEICPPIPQAVELIKWCKDLGFNLVLATNPLFPRIATMKRMMWGDINPNDFKVVTTYEDNYFLKPDTRYFDSLLQKLGYKASETLMIGNNVIEDLSAGQIGLSVFLLTDQIINTKNEDISKYPHGSFKELKQYILNLAKQNIY